MKTTSNTKSALVYMTQAQADPHKIFNIDAVLSAWCFNDAVVAFLQKKIDRSSPDYFCSWDILDAAKIWIEDAKNTPPPAPNMDKRSQATMAKEFITKPYDIFTIHHSSSMTNTIDIRITNDTTQEDFQLALKNTDKSWEMLKRIHEMGARQVLVQRDQDDPTPYHMSMPYLARFK